LALSAELSRDWVAAARHYQMQAEQSPQDAGIRDRWATALFRAGNFDEAFAQFDQAHRQDSARSRPEVSMGVMAVQSANYRGADAWFNRALAKYPSDANVHYQRMVALLYQDRTDEAEQFASAAARLGLNTPDFMWRRGQIAMQKRDFEKAQRYFETALANSPKSPLAMARLALTLAEQDASDKRSKAVALAQQAAQQQPDNPEVQMVLGWALYRVKETEAAENVLRSAVAASGDPAAMYFLARVLMSAGKNAEARRIAEQLRARIEQPRVFVYRPAARKWLDKVLEKTP
jgi:tetratricopeptide (TPR) repeat protein